MTELFAPPRYEFLHSTLAELVLRALLALEVASDHLEERAAHATTNELTAYLRYLAAFEACCVSDKSPLITGLETLLRGRLHLAGELEEARIKANVLADETIQVGIEANLHRCDFSFLNMCLLNLSRLLMDSGLVAQSKRFLK